MTIKFTVTDSYVDESLLQLAQSLKRSVAYLEREALKMNIGMSDVKDFFKSRLSIQSLMFQIFSSHSSVTGKYVTDALVAEASNEIKVRYAIISLPNNKKNKAIPD